MQNLSHRPSLPGLCSWALILLLWTTADTAPAQVAPTEAEKPAAYSYRIEIDAPAEFRPLLEEHLDIARWRDNPRMSPALLRIAHRDAPRQIAEVMESEGYYAARVTAELDEDHEPPRARYRIEAGPRCQVANVDIVFTGPLLASPDKLPPTPAALRNTWRLPAGSPFRHADWEDAKRALLQHLLANRYPAAHIVASAARVAPAAHTVELAVTIDSGPPHVFGSTAIAGLERYPEHIVRRISPLTAGEPYTTAKLLQFQSRLQDTGYFSHVEVAAVPAADTAAAADATVPVTVTVREAQSRTLGLGAGYSTNTGARGQLHYEDRNLFDRAWRLDGRLALEQKQQSLGAEVQLPVNADGSRDSFGASWLRTDIQNEITRTVGLRARHAWGSERTEHALLAEATLETKQVPPLADDRSGAIYFGYALTLRRTDSAIYPRDGYHAQLQAGGAPLGIIAERPFLRAWGRLAHYTPLATQGTLLLRGELGAVLSDARQGIPQTYLFRAGGDQSVRGHAYQSIGVREGEAIVGGRYLATASAEYLHWLTGQWGGAIFVDAGTASDRLGSGALAYGAGFGVRWKSPVGPLNLDLAQGRRSDSDTREWRLHFSMGFVF